MIAPTTPYTFKIGVNLPYTTASLGSSMTGIVNFLKLGIPDLATIDPTRTHDFSLVFTPTNYSAMTATQAMLNAVVDKGVSAVVGDYASSHTIPSSLAGTRTKTWMCSGSASSGTLSDKANYPYFMRTMATDPAQGEILAHFVKSMGWSSASVIASSDSYGQSVSGTFLTRAPALGITITASQVFQPGQTDFTGVLKAILAGGSQIIIAAMLPDDGVNLLRQAKLFGMVGPDTVWLGPEAWSLYADMGLSAADNENVNGFMYVMPREDSFNALYNTALARWNAAYPGVSVATYSFLFQDCVTTLAQGILRAVADVGLNSFLSGNYQPNMTKHFLVPFEGVSGTVKFDDKGNRLAYFSVFNFFKSERTLVYEVNPDMSVVAKAPPKFYSGTSEIPRDRPEQVPLFARWNQSSGIGLAIANALLLALILASNAYLYVHRTIPAVKNLSFPFLTLICVGCALVLASNLAALGEPTSGSCQVSLWFFTYGVQLVLASSAAKAYRIWSIFDNKAMISVSRVGNKSLLSGVAVVMLIQTILLVVWSGAGPQLAQIVSSRTYYYYVCQSASPTFNMGLSGATLAYNILLLCVLTILAYKTRNVASGFRESIWLFYVSQNMFLSGIVVALFAFFSFGDSTLAAFVVKQVVIIYATTFTFTALVGRLVYVVYLQVKRNGGGGSAGGQGSNQGCTSEGGTASMTRSALGTANGTTAANKVAVAEVNGKVTHVRSTYPVKKQGGLMSTWHSHNVILSVIDSQLSMLPANTNPELGVVVRLSAAIIDITPPGLRNCIEVSARGKAWAIQLPGEEEYQKWVAILSSALGAGGGPGATTGMIKRTTSGNGGGGSPTSSKSRAMSVVSNAPLNSPARK
ncbi:hypothetical protein H9P43_002525 [Blastocladiella emersonii ATCC 22665]|nr:hypothetical protein H9P43_002525 [Blastocladiella emersonii ATCC 22665]